ncbi:MAG: LPS biosynthesis protein [Candidatus Taylorbacteria bacterium RIFCSPLOWO2_12_FULL_43_20]|uniref:LPS biosynthesis protein n=1 Tax=Candidatus Taylorbacteria bacterium RIFCSPLOWO2_12_FULL_43_20 TaxID=1802332 RepID=A0A1G2P0T0_9BACT|nr:MAG: LPS biosynthesis protein [Candidatus Taylorbacteria bacterium RIFCSPHIGHO2_01_FULL_43_120]OHA22422.1 MAG: LPS biosynthesis protein [Candidatus Taylorbacteria bacterium RIFCSPHIGHO2_02_FULL_43_55]OHA28361.1 MAG: LPS biosynthesis protein [Candidatus Taylorbacteria bacterium RIFCSPHIGHO2_12_FULL_42_34]OHA30635.1 MAG: LPS biosynthesis protein [Candidatus Taylorbacteria bacterium RIFCSPLOWO2_01_FULL_43_83]OHA38532.1 MAG: LPS biosynthesis protein [Candidatus Taylorbacteria bacterium RIFCSPLOW
MINKEQTKMGGKSFSPGYGLPGDVKFCKKCVIPNTRPTASNEYTHMKRRPHDYISFDDEGVCSACRFCEAKFDGTIDWKKREEELLELLDKYRSKDGSYDCLVPGSGGKDSVYASHILKTKYGMHPLTVTWAPHLYTDIGWKNFQNWSHVAGHDNYLFTPNGKVHRMLTRNAFLNLLHPFQPFILGQKTFAVKMAARFGIPLVFYGPCPGENGGNTPITQNKYIFKDSESETDNKNGFRMDYVNSSANFDEIYLGGKKVSDYFREGLTQGDLAPYLPLDTRVIKEKNIGFYFLGYYLKWVPQECYYYAVQNAGFEANPARSEGTYSKYSSLDDKTDGFFYYTTYIKFGYGRATQDAAQEIRHGHITREEGVALVNRFDGEFPKKYFKEFLDYIDLSESEFWVKIDEFRDSLLWEKTGQDWKLKYKIT